AGVLQLGLGVVPLIPTARPPTGPLVGLASFDQVLVLVGMMGLARSGAMRGGWTARSGTALADYGVAALALAEPVTLEPSLPGWDRLQPWAGHHEHRGVALESIGIGAGQQCPAHLDVLR